MAVDGSMLNEYVGKKIKIILVNEQGTLKGILTKDGKKFFLENKKNYYIKNCSDKRGVKQ